jgi:mono/diheme cytochrome c family protein
MRIRNTLVCAAAAWLASAAVALTQSPSRTVWDGVFTSEQAARGAPLYAANCAQCHGPALSGADGPPLSGVEFAGNWNGLTLGDLFERIRTTMPADDPMKIGAQEKADILAFMLRTSEFPAGTTELPKDAQALMQIRYASTKP